MSFLFVSFIMFCGLCCLVSFFISGVFKQMGLLCISWSSPYECGFSSNSLSLNCFSFTYFSLMVFFVIFDLEISLLLNMPDQGLLYFNFLYYYLFMVMLAVGFMFEVFFGYVRWGY